MNEHTLTWTAPEYEHREHGADWYWSLGIISVSLAVAFVIVGNMLLSIIILLGVGTLLYYAKHPPKDVAFEISKKGILAGETMYMWDTLESFWIVKRDDSSKDVHRSKILLISKKLMMPHIVVPLDESIVEEVHQILSHMLHEERQVETLPERLIHKIGF